MITYLLRFPRQVWRFLYRHRHPVRDVIRARKIRRISFTELIAEQERRFADAGFDWQRARNAVEAVVGPNEDPSSHRSEHYEVFAALCETMAVRDVLEIGTAEGEFTAFMARLAPSSRVVTIDLPSTDERFWRATRAGTSTREGGADAKDIAARDGRLAAHPNVSSIPMNSLMLSSIRDAQYDVVWVDGDHSYPIVAVDIVNSLRIVRPNGVVLCDDVYLGRSDHSAWVGDETSATLEALERAGLVEVHLVLKKLFPSKNYDLARRRYVAIVRPLPSAWQAPVRSEGSAT